MPLRLNVDQVSGRGQGRGRGGAAASRPLGLTRTFPLQDALLFLKDFFTSLVAGIAPMVPAESSTEGEELGQGGLGAGLLPPSHPQACP